MLEDPLVAPETVFARLGDRTLLLLDIRGEVIHEHDAQGNPRTRYCPLPEEYEKGHIPGALFVDFTQDITDPRDPVPLQLASAERFGTQMGRLGVDEQKWVVVYDGRGSYLATRLWWALRAYGHPKVSVLNGGLAAWQAKGYPVRAGLEAAFASRWSPRPKPLGRMVIEEVWDFVRQGKGIVLDARSPERYAEGHIPGAYNLPFFLLTDPQSGRLLEPKQVEEILRARGIPQDRSVPIVCTCGSGHSATLLYLELERLGFKELWVYDGSWNEWSQSRFPKEKGEAASPREPGQR
jgi:thiosulfate/3-mercaptopyruvate sulfurtransferase